MLVLFSSVIEGGILQFATTILKVVAERNKDVVLFIPTNARICMDNHLNCHIIRYKKEKNIFLNSSIKLVSESIHKLKPDTIWYLDNCVVSSRVANLLHKTHIKQIVTIHDPEPHPTNSRRVIKKIHLFIESFFKKRMEKTADTIVLLSNESKKIYIKKKPKLTKKTYVLNLGSHIPQIAAKPPKDFKYHNYVLFFGRIDKYKGLKRFIDTAAQRKNLTFVIAGKGELTKEEHRALSFAPNVVLLNTYIPDDEMVYLFKNSKCLFLPYIEASQSGVIPIAYQFGKPVIVSDAKGLSQFVEDGKTGFICHNNQDYLKAVDVIFGDRYDYFSKNAIDYYCEHLDFEKNIFLFLDEQKNDKYC